MAPVVGRRLRFKFGGLPAMSLFLRHLRLTERSSLAEAAKAHFGSFSVTVTLREGDSGAAVQQLAVEGGGQEQFE